MAYNSLPSISGKTVMITGSNRGIGFHTANHLAQNGARIIFATRNSELTRISMDKILATTPDAVLEHENVDLSSLRSIQRFSEEIDSKYDKIDVLINNAAYWDPRSPKMSVDGFDMHYAVNYLAPFLLTNNLLKHLQNGGSRIIGINCKAHISAQIDTQNLNTLLDSVPNGYANSKMLAMVFANSFHSKFDFYGINSFSVNPGVTNTDLYSHLTDMNRVILDSFSKVGFVKDPETSSKIVAYHATKEDMNPEYRYFDGMNVGSCPTFTLEEEVQDRIWDFTNETLEKAFKEMK